MKYGLAYNQFHSSGTSNSHSFQVIIQDLSESDLPIFKKYFEEWLKIGLKISTVESGLHHSMFKNKTEKDQNSAIKSVIEKYKKMYDVIVGTELSDQNATFRKLVGREYVYVKFSEMTIGDMGQMWDECKFIIPMINKNSI